MNPTELLYESKPSFKSLGQRYRIFSDHLQLRILCRPFTIPIAEILEIAVFNPPVFRTSFLALKLDMADLFRHVGIKRRRGLFKQIRFTPDDPEAFCRIVRNLLASA